MGQKDGARREGRAALQNGARAPVTFTCSPALLILSNWGRGPHAQALVSPLGKNHAFSGVSVLLRFFSRGIHYFDINTEAKN